MSSALPIVLGLITALLALAMIPRTLTYLTPPTGDEVFYLVTARSLWEDRSLDEARQWEAEAWRQFYPANAAAADYRGWPSFPDPLAPHASQTQRPADEVYSKHGPGVAVLIAPAVGLAGRAGALAVFALLGGLLAVNVALLAQECGAGRLMVAGIGAALCFSAPLFPYMLVVFPALPAALLTAYTFRRFLRWEDSGLGSRFLTGSALALLPWLHTLFVLLALPFAAVLLWLDVRASIAAVPAPSRAARNLWPTAVWVLPGLVSASGMLGWHFFLYGAVWPNFQDHAGFNTLDVATWHGFLDSGGAILGGLAGVLLDGQWGMLIAAPVYLLAIVAAFTVARRSPRVLAGMLIVLPYCLAVALYRQWWGEWCPPARYLAPVAPLAAAPLALLLTGPAAWRSWPLLVLLTLPGLLITTLYAGSPQLLFQHPDRISVVARQVSVLLSPWVASDLATWLPSFIPQYPYQSDHPVPLARNLVWIVMALLTAGGALRYFSTSAGSGQGKGLPPIPATGLPPIPAFPPTGGKGRAGDGG